MKSNNTVIRVLAAIAVLALAVYILRGPHTGWLAPNEKEIQYSEFLADVNNKKIASGSFDSPTKDYFEGKYLHGGTNFKVYLGADDAFGRVYLDKLLYAQGVTFKKTPPIISDAVSAMLMTVLLPLMLIFFFWMFVMRQAQSGGNQALTFGRSRAKRLTDSVPKVTFDDVAGVEEAKQELQEVVEFLRNAKKFQALGAKIPKGVLLLGPPGCGKTMLARAIAGEAGVPFFHISGSDFVEMFVGVGASRVRDLFDTAKANRPSLIFIDEIDAVGRQRGAGLGGGHDEREQTLNQLLVEMDGFDTNAGVIMIAATNRPDVLDPALLRPGRFDRHVTVDTPDVKGREAILNVHLRGKPLDEEVNSHSLARRTPGFSGADLANLANEAALLAARREKTKIEMSDFNESIDRVVAGPERKSRIVNDQIRERIAYHELGHAIVGELLPHANPVHKVSILPRGRALGYTMQYPTEDKYLTTRQEFLDEISALLAGRVAEETVYNEVTTGASNDFERATAISRAMVCEYGMSERLGPVVLGNRHGNPFLGRDWNEERNYSETIAVEIDKEVRSIIDECYERSRQILLENRGKMDEIVQVLLEKESLERDEFIALMTGAKAPEPAVPPASTPPAGDTAVPPTVSEKRRPLPNLRPEPA
ncbi:MAG: ATP-dependent zinc metalloprotease FtsH [Capsulimonadaceae bacterium]